MWIHGALSNGPNTRYPPTAKQFEAFVSFLLADGAERPHCPLPIHGTPQNRPRWDAYAFTDFHIFRDRYERKIRPVQPGRSFGPRRVVKTVLDWPEMADEVFLIQKAQLHYSGVLSDEEAVSAAEERLR